jgi:hypothetical protein
MDERMTHPARTRAATGRRSAKYPVFMQARQTRQDNQTTLKRVAFIKSGIYTIDCTVIKAIQLRQVQSCNPWSICLVLAEARLDRKPERNPAPNAVLVRAMVRMAGGHSIANARTFLSLRVFVFQDGEHGS